MTDAHPKLTRIRAQIANLAVEAAELRDGVRPESEASCCS